MKMQAAAATSGGSSEDKAADEPASFIAAKKWEGSKEGYIFQMGPEGLGYYPDPLGPSSKATTTKTSEQAASKKRSNVFAPSAASSLKKTKVQSSAPVERGKSN